MSRVVQATVHAHHGGVPPSPVEEKTVGGPLLLRLRPRGFPGSFSAACKVPLTIVASSRFGWDSCDLSPARVQALITAQSVSMSKWLKPDWRCCFPVCLAPWKCQVQL